VLLEYIDCHIVTMVPFNILTTASSHGLDAITGLKGAGICGGALVAWQLKQWLQ